MDIDVTCKTLRRPWCARLSGVEWYTPSDTAEIEPKPRMRFTRIFNSGCTVTPVLGQQQRYRVSIFGDGIYEVRVPGHLSQFYAIRGDKSKRLPDPYPDNWGEYMEENGVDYEGVWFDIWACLQRQYDRFAGAKAEKQQPKAFSELPEAEQQALLSDLDIL